MFPGTDDAVLPMRQFLGKRSSFVKGMEQVTLFVGLVLAYTITCVHRAILATPSTILVGWLEKRAIVFFPLGRSPFSRLCRVDLL